MLWERHPPCSALYCGRVPSLTLAACSLSVQDQHRLSSGISVNPEVLDSKPLRTSQVALVLKNLPASAGDIRDVGSIPGSGRPPGRGDDNHSSTFGWRIPGTEEPGRLWIQLKRQHSTPLCPVTWFQASRGFLSSVRPSFFHWHCNSTPYSGFLSPPSRKENPEQTQAHFGFYFSVVLIHA